MNQNKNFSAIKRLNLFIGSFFFVMYAMAQGQLTFSPKVQYIKGNTLEAINGVFKFKNTGNAPVSIVSTNSINSIKTSFTKGAIKPNEEGYVNFTYKNNFDGHIRKPITIKDSNNRLYRIIIDGVITKAWDDASGRLYEFIENDKHGVKDANGNTVLMAESDTIDFYENLFEVIANGKHGVKDVKGKTILNTVYNSVSITGDKILTMKDGFFRVYTKQGVETFSLECKNYKLEDEGFYFTNKSGKMAFYDLHLKCIIPFSRNYTQIKYHKAPKEWKEYKAEYYSLTSVGEYFDVSCDSYGALCDRKGSEIIKINGFSMLRPYYILGRFVVMALRNEIGDVVIFGANGDAIYDIGDPNNSENNISVMVCYYVGYYYIDNTGNIMRKTHTEESILGNITKFPKSENLLAVSEANVASNKNNSSITSSSSATTTLTVAQMIDKPFGIMPWFTSAQKAKNFLTQNSKWPFYYFYDNTLIWTSDRNSVSEPYYQRYNGLCGHCYYYINDGNWASCHYMFVAQTLEDALMVARSITKYLANIGVKMYDLEDETFFYRYFSGISPKNKNVGKHYNHKCYSVEINKCSKPPYIVEFEISYP